jgi:hypothetical protein
MLRPKYSGTSPGSDSSLLKLSIHTLTVELKVDLQSNAKDRRAGRAGHTRLDNLQIGSNLQPLGQRGVVKYFNALKRLLTIVADCKTIIADAETRAPSARSR